MIGEVQRALRGLFTPLLPDGFELRFGPPAPEPAAALVVFLADIREDEKAAGTDWEDVRDDNGIVVARRPPQRRFDLYYLITVTASDPEREAELLDAVLTAVDPGRRLDPALLGDGLAGAPVVLRLATDAAAAYTRLGLPPRTVIGIVASAPLVLPLRTDIAAPADRISMGVARPGRVPPPPAAAGTPRRRWRGAAIEEE